MNNNISKQWKWLKKFRLGLHRDILAGAKNPVLLCGGGVVIGDAIAEARALAEFVSMPVCVTYLHNDAFPADHPLMCGPLGYQGHQGAMNIIAEADVVIALGMCNCA